MTRQAFIVEQPRHGTLRALNYEPAVERLRRTSQGQRIVRLRELVADLGSGYATVFARIACEPEYGVELLSQSDMFAAEPQGRIIRRDSMEHPERHEVQKWQVLIAGAGTLAPTELYGRAIIADDRLVGKYVGQDSLIIKFKEPGSDASLFAYAYLASATGLKALRASSYGTKILRIRRDILAELPVPQPDDATVKHVADLVRKCVERREVSSRELQMARGELEALPEMLEAHAMCAERRAHCITWNGELVTLSAWTYASTGGALEHLQRQWKARLGDALVPNGLFNGPRFARVNCDPPHGIEFMSQRDTFLIRPIARRIMHPGFEERMLFARRGTIMIGGHGTLGEGEIFGKAMYIHGRFVNNAFTQDLLRVVPSSGNEALTYAFCTTLVGMRLLRSTAVGTKILSMRPDLLVRLPFPELDEHKMKRIGDHVDSAVNAREEADAAETEAIRIIEEEVLPAWLA